MGKGINLDVIKEELGNLNSIIEEKKQLYEQRSKSIDEQYHRLKEMEKYSYEKELKEINAEIEDLLNESYFVSIGDLKKELMAYYSLKDDEIKVNVKVFDDIEGHYTEDKRISMVKGKDEYISRVYVEIISKDFYYRFMYKMNFNMLQADSISFVDHCYLINDFRYNFNKDDYDLVSNLGVYPDRIDNILIKIPNLALIYESEVDYDGALIIDRNTRYEYYYNSPLIPFRDCVVNCVNKEKQVSLTRTISK